jgi:hypothetical protein
MRIIAKTDIDVKLYFYKVWGKVDKKKEGTEAPS